MTSLMRIFVKRHLKIPGFFGSIATRTMGDSSKCKPVNEGQKISVESVADLTTNESR